MKIQKGAHRQAGVKETAKTNTNAATHAETNRENRQAEQGAQARNGACNPLVRAAKRTTDVTRGRVAA